MPNILDVQNAILDAKKAAAEYVAANPEGPNWYPCGFAWLTYRCRKNAKEAGSLLNEGFRWDDYAKYYYLSPYEWTNTQSMDYKADILRAAANAAAKHNIPFNVVTRID